MELYVLLRLVGQIYDKSLVVQFSKSKNLIIVDGKVVKFESKNSF